MTSLIARLAQRVGLGGAAPHDAHARAAGLQLPFARLPEAQRSIFWNDGPCLQRLLELPRGALSGPVQEDKARAHAALTRLIRRDRNFCVRLDLRQLDGLGGSSPDGIGHPSFEAYAATAACRRMRIISYKDFQRALGSALPALAQGGSIEVRQASWLGERLYWAGEHHGEAFACAVAYARLRGLEVLLPAEVIGYRLDPAGIQALDAQYHAVTLPAHAWDDRAFMALLLDSQAPYARLTLLHDPGNSELLLLEKGNPTANAIGEGLKQAGAADLVRYLRDLPQITGFKLGEPVDD